MVAQPPRVFPEVEPDTRGQENTICKLEQERECIVIAFQNETAKRSPHA